MKLTNQEIKAALSGAVYIQEVDGAVCPYRFTKEQLDFYAEKRPGFGKRPVASAGIRLFFKTDSETLSLKVNVSSGSSRSYYGIDLFVNGVYADCMDNLGGAELTAETLKDEFPCGVATKTFSLGKGMKEVRIYFPFSCRMEILEVELEDGSYFEPLKRKKKLLSFGDSITQGYDTLHPSNRYTAILADFLDAEEINKGIGGEVFVPELAELREDFDPDYITVAYGCNDWGKKTASIDLPANCKRFYETVSRLYPKAQIFALTPVWRADYLTKCPPFGAFEKVAELIFEVAESLPNVTAIDGFSFVPHDPAYYSDLRIHPNDEGFKHYGNNLYQALKEYIQ